MSVIRCVMLYDYQKMDVKYLNKRQCNKSYTESIVELKHQINQSPQVNYTYNKRTEWHGHLEEKSNLYYLIMCFHGTNEDWIAATLEQLYKTVSKTQGIERMTKDEFQRNVGANIDQVIKRQEEQYILQFNPNFMPSDDEQGGNQFQSQGGQSQSANQTKLQSSALQTGNQSMNQLANQTNSIPLTTTTRQLGNSSRIKQPQIIKQSSKQYMSPNPSAHNLPAGGPEQLMHDAETHMSIFIGFMTAAALGLAVIILV